MKQSILGKLIAIAVIGAACVIGSVFILALVNERQVRAEEAHLEVANSWGKRQVLIGPMLVVRSPEKKQVGAPQYEEKDDVFILPSSLTYNTTLEPEIRKRGIFETVVYNSTTKVSGEFSSDDIKKNAAIAQSGIFSVVITDTRGIEKQINLTWGGSELAFEPGHGTTLSGYQEAQPSGLHASVRIDPTQKSIPFSFEVTLKGSEGISIAPTGKETTILASSSWITPKFVGEFLPSDHSITDSGFVSEWRISSFGRPYPQTWRGGEYDLATLYGSTAGVDLHDQVDAYGLTLRSAKYAILFIVMTFAAFFLFDVLTKIRIHSIQYLLIGSALALFYLLLLSLSEHIGFLFAYIVATCMILALIGSYSVFVLKSVTSATPIVLLLVFLYGYLYFTLQLEDYALLFGSFLLFLFLSVIMFFTRNIDWFGLDKGKEEITS